MTNPVENAGSPDGILRLLEASRNQSSTEAGVRPSACV